jgi:predicted dehydrogenase
MTRWSRRQFLQGAALAAGLTLLGPGLARSYAANEAVHVGVIGVQGMGRGNHRALERCEAKIAGLCDVERNRLQKAGQDHPKVKQWTDFREMIAEQKGLDAVMVSTPDHTHAVASLAAMQAGLHVATEKPLTHSIWEGRQLAKAARATGVVTQMDNEGHSEKNMARLVEAVRAGAVGTVREVHIITNRPIWLQGMSKMSPSQSVPDGLAWDLWLGPAPRRPYHNGLHPCKWRGWWDFGTGALGDMGCHYFDATMWSLELGSPETVEADAEGAPTLRARPLPRLLMSSQPGKTHGAGASRR